jgi:hypothetical protein
MGEKTPVSYFEIVYLVHFNPVLYFETNKRAHNTHNRIGFINPPTC